MNRAQQKSIDTLNQMLPQLLEDKKKKPKTKTPSKKSKGKRKERESSSSTHTKDEEHSNFEPSKPPSEVEVNSENESTHSKRMGKLEKCLKALANRKGLQKVGVVWPYPSKWDLILYPLKFKAPTLQAFDGKGSPNHHIYYFKSHTRNVVSNDAILARLFIGILKGIAFEWFMKLPKDSIKNWGDLEKLFLTRFFKDDSKITMPTLLMTRQWKGEPIKVFVGRFWNMVL